MAFWMLSGVAAALAAWILLTFARRGEDMPVGVPDPQHELDELERLRARGLMSDEAHAVAHAEAARRLLRETPVGEAPLRPRPRDRPCPRRSGSIWCLVPRAIRIDRMPCVSRSGRRCRSFWSPTSWPR